MAITLTVVLLCGLLTGCMGVVNEIEIQPDGSGTVTVSVGYTEEGLELLASMEGSQEPISTEGMTAFTYNGYTYYGQVETVSFTNVEELNQLLNAETEEEESVATGNTEVVYVMEQEKDGSFVFSVKATKLQTEEPAEEATDPETEAMVEELTAQMTAVLEIAFPSAVTQTAGLTEGVTIDGNLLVLDTIAMGEAEATEMTYVFSTAVDAVGIAKITFDDVNQPAWYYDAVMALANGGLVTGIGNNLFDPEGALTYAQFCQILARAEGLPTGAANDYWAYTAIESCLDAGYILDRGVITAENFDAVIPREAAVSAMYLAKKADIAVGTDVKSEDIPDYASVSDAYKENVLAAYNSGITTGVDESKTFKPQDTLTRAQVCQLFYNLNWTTAE